jgi:hypothetical protein
MGVFQTRSAAPSNPSFPRVLPETWKALLGIPVQLDRELAELNRARQSIEERFNRAR